MDILLQPAQRRCKNDLVKLEELPVCRLDPDGIASRRRLSIYFRDPRLVLDVSTLNGRL
jgi:hypothetical protein